MKRNFESLSMLPSKRQRYSTSVLGKRNYDTQHSQSHSQSSKRARLPPGILGKHHIEHSDMPTAKKSRIEETESLRNFLVSAHTTIENQKQRILELEQRVNELAYLNLMYSNQMKNPTYKHLIECY